jgi:putative ABC transport system permease protein
LFGFLLGMLISHGGMMILAGYLEDSYQYSFSGTMFLTEEIYLFIGAMLIGLLAAIVPAMQAYRIDISETLARS